MMSDYRCAQLARWALAAALALSASAEFVLLEPAAFRGDFVEGWPVQPTTPRPAPCSTHS